MMFWTSVYLHPTSLRLYVYSSSFTSAGVNWLINVVVGNDRMAVLIRVTSTKSSLANNQHLPLSTANFLLVIKLNSTASHGCVLSSCFASSHLPTLTLLFYPRWQHGPRCKYSQDLFWLWLTTTTMSNAPIRLPFSSSPSLSPVPIPSWLLLFYLFSTSFFCCIWISIYLLCSHDDCRFLSS